MKKQIYYHILILSFMLIIITVITYFAEKNKILFYEWYRSLYAIPVIWFGLLYGKIGSIPVAIGVITLYFPVLMREVQKSGFGQIQVNLLFSIIGINILGVLIGHFAGGERKLRQKGELLSDVSLKFRSFLDEDLIYKNLLSELVRIIEVEEGELCLKESDRLMLKTIVGAGFIPAQNVGIQFIELEENRIDKSSPYINKNSIFYKVIETSNPLISNGVLEDERFILPQNVGVTFMTPEKESLINQTTTNNIIKNTMVLPIKLKDETIGVIGLANKKGDALFSKDDLNLSQTIIQSAVASIENLKLFEEKTKIKNIFSTYVTSQVAEEILKDPDKLQLGGKKCEVTILFADIRGFTSISEKLPPEEVVSHLNEYFSAMIDINF